MDKDQALAYIGARQLLADAWRMERVRLEQIIDTALLHTDPTSHWEQYEMLKRWAGDIAGWNARHKELRTDRHYAVLLEFIGHLLYQNEPKEVCEIVDGWLYEGRKRETWMNH